MRERESSYEDRICAYVHMIYRGDFETGCKEIVLFFEPSCGTKYSGRSPPALCFGLGWYPAMLLLSSISAVADTVTNYSSSTLIGLKFVRGTIAFIMVGIDEASHRASMGSC
jgi:hypothetical protein